MRDRRLPAALLILALAGCATAGGGTSGGVLPARPESAWPVRTRYHVDLWLHGFAMLQADTAQIPFFKRGYRDALAARKTRANVVTQLDLNRDRLRARLAANRDLTNAQFLALYFASWEDLYIALQTFLQTEGDPRRASDPRAQAIIATLAAAFPSAADREWARLFTLSMSDENEKFFRAYWAEEQRARAATLARVDTLWTRDYFPKLRGYLNGTRLSAGDFLLALPLNGEGRTVTPAGGTAITTGFPDNVGAALEAIYVFAHEAVSPVASVAVTDNITPSEQRAGAAERYTSSALVRGGAMLLRRVAPELLNGYAQYYLRAAAAQPSRARAGAAQPAGAGSSTQPRAASGNEDPEAALARVFPLPDAIRDAIARQLEVVLGGI